MRRLSLHSVANCLYRRGRMVEEWIARDGLARALQTGQDPETLARALSFRGYSGSWLQPAPADVLAEGDSGPRPDDFRAECELVLELIQEVWNRRNFAALGNLIVRDVFLHSSGETTYIRPKGYQDETLRLLLAFPTAQFEVRDIQTNENARYAGLRISVLWKMTGPYEGRPLDGTSPTRTSTSWASPSSWSRAEESSASAESSTRLLSEPKINLGRGDQPPADGGNIYFV